MSGFRLTSCVWELTLACCFGCRYCGSAGGRARADELTTAECMDAAEQLADLGCRRVSLIGGEVFLRRDWAQIAGRLTGLGDHQRVHDVAGGAGTAEAGGGVVGGGIHRRAGGRA